MPTQSAKTLGNKTRESLPLILLGAMFIAGALCGTRLYGGISEDTARSLMLLLSGDSAGEFSFFYAWGATFFSNLSLLLLLFLCGFCAISQPIILLVPLIKGMGFGLVAACNAAQFSPYSAFFWLRFMPGALLFAVLLLLCSKEALLLCSGVFDAVFSQKQSTINPSPAAYALKYLLFTVMCGVFSLLDVVFDLIYTVIST